MDARSRKARNVPESPNSAPGREMSKVRNVPRDAKMRKSKSAKVSRCEPNTFRLFDYSRVFCALLSSGVEIVSWSVSLASRVEGAYRGLEACSVGFGFSPIYCQP